MANSYLNRTPSSAGNRKTCTFSAWVKRGNIGNNTIIGCYSANNDNDLLTLTLRNNGELRVSAYNVNWRILNRLFRDTNAWYHIVLTIDTTQSTANDRIKVYVNGVQETSFSTINNPSQNADIGLNQASTTRIGAEANVVQNHFDGYMSHVAFVDGTALTPSSFGETDSTSGIWKFKAPSGVTWGTNGFHLKFENSGNLGLDSSGNSNTFTVNGNGRQALDTPSNVFATFMPLIPRIAGGSPVQPTFSNGNTTAYFDNAGYNENAVGSIAMKGKIYFEVKCTNANSDGSGYVGMVDLSGYDNGFIGTQCIAYRDSGEKINIGTSTSYGNTWTSGDIIGVAFDSATGTIWFSKNGTWQNSATITEIANGTTTNSAFTGLSGDFLPLVSNYSDRYASVNFGNGYFGTTAITSAGSNGNGSLFEYDVPSGYYALNTKNINTYG